MGNAGRSTPNLRLRGGAYGTTNPYYTHGKDPYMINEDRIYLRGNPLVGFGVVVAFLVVLGILAALTQ